jgi:hypothetical protein
MQDSIPGIAAMFLPIGVERVAAASLPEALTLGSNAESGVAVYYGLKDLVPTYVGITSDMLKRQLQHGAKYFLQRISEAPVTRGEARAIEQAIIVRNPGFSNIRNSVSPSHPWYQQAVDWGEAWLRSNGF